MNIHIRAYPYHTSSNGLVERFVQTFKVALWHRKMVCCSHTAWLASVLSNYCTTPLRTTLVPSLALFMGSLLRMRLDLLLPNSGSTVSSHPSSQKQHRTTHSRPHSLQLGQVVMFFRLLWKLSMCLYHCCSTVGTCFLRIWS